MDEKLSAIKSWLGTGSINIFGLPMSGKDTVAVRLAELLGGKMLSSGIIIRAMEKDTKQPLSASGNLIPSDVFANWVLPYFSRPELKDFPLILSSVGRWSGEEDAVMQFADLSGHPIKAVILLNISENDVIKRWELVHSSGARELNSTEQRADDKDIETFKIRLDEFRKKTLPVVMHYRSLDLLIQVNADAPRDVVLDSVIDELYNYAISHQ